MKRSDSSQEPRTGDSRSEDRLDRFWAAFREEDYKESLPRVRKWLVRRTEADATSGSWWTSISRTPAFRMALISLALVMLIGAGRIPVSTTSTLGYLIAGTSSESDQALLEAIQKLDLPTYRSISTGFDGRKSHFSIVLPGVSEDQVQAWTSSLRDLLGDVQISTNPVREKNTTRLYSVILQTLHITVDATGASDEEVIQRIDSQLRSLGIYNAIIEQSRSADGDKNIEITIPSPSE